MSKSSSRARAVKPIRVSPLLTRYIPTLAAAPAGATAGVVASPVREPLISKTIFGMTLNRFRDGLELVYADGHKLAARSPWGLLAKMFRRGKK
jgi:hypothetical protein